MINCFIIMIFSILGIFGFYSDVKLLLTIAGIILIIDNLYSFISGQLKSLGLPIFASIIGLIIVDDIWQGICIGLCFETIISSLLGFLMIAFFAKNN